MPLRPPVRYQRELEIARAVADDTGRYLLSVYGSIEGRRKPDGTLVSDADLESTRRAVARIRDAFPDDAVVTEETETAYAGDRRVWILDPLDGTTNYCTGVPLWGVTLALVEERRPVVGISVFPTLRRTYVAVRGAGAWRGPNRLRGSGQRALDDESIVGYCSRALRCYRLGVGRRRALGSAALSYALVVEGELDVSLLARPRVWDLAAGWLLAEEAGLSVEPIDGPSPWPLEPGQYAGRAFPTLVAASSALAAAVRERLVCRADGPVGGAAS